MSSEFDKVSYWRQRSMKRFQDLTDIAKPVLREVGLNIAHIEGQIPPEWDAAVKNLNLDLFVLQNIIIEMGKPKEAHEETGKKAPQSSPQPQEKTPKKT